MANDEVLPNKRGVLCRQLIVASRGENFLLTRKLPPGKQPLDAKQGRGWSQKLQHLPGKEDDSHLALVQTPRDLKKNETVSIWIPPRLIRPYQVKSNWVWSHGETRKDSPCFTREFFRIPYIDSLGYETNSLYAYWYCTPEEYVLSRSRTILTRWFHFFDTHQLWSRERGRRGRKKPVDHELFPGLAKQIRMSKAALLWLSTYDSVYFMNRTWLQDRIHGILRHSSKNNVARRLWSLVWLLESPGHKNPRCLTTHEVFRTRVHETLRFLYPAYSRRYGDKCPKKRNRAPSPLRYKKGGKSLVLLDQSADILSHGRVTVLTEKPYDRPVPRRHAFRGSVWVGGKSQ